MSLTSKGSLTVPYVSWRVTAGQHNSYFGIKFTGAKVCEVFYELGLELRIGCLLIPLSTHLSCDLSTPGRYFSLFFFKKVDIRSPLHEIALSYAS